MHQRRHAVLVLCACVTASAVAPTGCGNRSARIARTNDELRITRESQDEWIKDLESRNLELNVKLAEANRERELPYDDSVLAAMPRAVGIKLDRFTTVDDGRGIWSLTTIDGRNRFVQVAGTLTVTAETRDEPSRVLASKTLSPRELRDAYVTGLTGAGYRIKSPLLSAVDPSTPLVDRPESVTVRMTATLTDEITGLVHESEREVVVRLRPAAERASQRR